MKVRALILSGVAAGLVTVLHFVAHGYIWAQAALASQFQATTRAVIHGLATDLGYAPAVVQLEQYTLDDLAEKEALIVGLNPALVRAVMHVESRGQVYAQSPKGATGPLQIMPANYKRCGLEHWSKLWLPEVNVKCGVQILSEELKTYKGDVVSALMAYNGGPQAIKRRYPESVKYSQLVLGRLAKDIR